MTIVYIAFLVGIGAVLIASWRNKPTAPEDASTPEEKRLLAELAVLQWSGLSEIRKWTWSNMFRASYLDAEQLERLSAIKRRLSELRREREARENSDQIT